jgi:hypothetical protein
MRYDPINYFGSSMAVGSTTASRSPDDSGFDAPKGRFRVPSGRPFAVAVIPGLAPADDGFDILDPPRRGTAVSLCSFERRKPKGSWEEWFSRSAVRSATTIRVRRPARQRLSWHPPR